MVQNYKSSVRVYKNPFELVMAAYVRRFPTCDMIPVLVGTDILKEETSEDGTIEIIERRCKLNVDAPYLLKKMAGVDYFYCIQRNTLDKRARKLVIEAWNETFAKKIVIKEYCTYFVHPENEDWTCFEQSASMEVKSLFGFESAVEKLAVKHYAQSIEKGKEIIESYIQQLFDEGITYVPRFQETTITIETMTVKLTTDNDSNYGAVAAEEQQSPVSSNHDHQVNQTNVSDENHKQLDNDKSHGAHNVKKTLIEKSTSLDNDNSSKTSTMEKKHSLTMTNHHHHHHHHNVGESHRESRSESQPQSRRNSTGNRQQYQQVTESHSQVSIGGGVGGQSPQLLSPTTSPPTSNGSVKNQVMSKAKNKLCIIYNVINENIQQREPCN